MFNRTPQTILCMCGRGIYKTSPVVIAIGKQIAYESSRLTFFECLVCSAKWIMRFIDGRPYQHTITETDDLVRWDLEEHQKQVAPPPRGIKIQPPELEPTTADDGGEA